MIRGTVTDNREALIRLTVLGSRGQKRNIEAVIDTGYDGCLSLPPELIAKLGLRWRRRAKATLADGSEISFDVFGGTVLWDGRHRAIPIDESDSAPLVGMALLEGYELTIKVRRGGRVTITRLRG